jgi:hypothetical protein
MYLKTEGGTCGSDALLQAWDLARAISADEHLAPELIHEVSSWHVTDGWLHWQERDCRLWTER